MYASCMFCRKHLGTNEVVESFPVGRRLAFDAARGRLWVVCAKCERWNLTPLEERWEAVEDCERLFRGTRVRASTDNVGLARHPEGLTLVRIGRPLRPEFAAWRYGDQFGRRMRRSILYGAAATLAVGGVAVGGLAAGVTVGLVFQAPNWFHIWNAWFGNRTRVELRSDRARPVELKQRDLSKIRILGAEDDPGFRLLIRRGRRETVHEGAEAHRFAAAILPKINASGGTRGAVRNAVNLIEDSGHPERFMREVARDVGFTDWHGTPGYIDRMPKPHRLALEMALHEERERRALEGELWLLERAWLEAEEIADISDKLLLPEETEEFMRENRPGPAEPPGENAGTATAR